jgi:hypothetical protein
LYFLQTQSQNFTDKGCTLDIPNCQVSVAKRKFYSSTKLALVAQFSSILFGRFITLFLLFTLKYEALHKVYTALVSSCPSNTALRFLRTGYARNIYDGPNFACFMMNFPHVTACLICVVEMLAFLLRIKEVLVSYPGSRLGFRAFPRSTETNVLT